MEPEVRELVADGADLAYIPIELTDSSGVIRPLADRAVRVEVSGAGDLLGFGIADPPCAEGFSAGRHATYYGRALAVVRARRTPGEVTVRVEAEGCEPVRIVIPVLPGPRAEQAAGVHGAGRTI